MEIAVLFARSDSVYKSIPGCDVFDIDRDARNWPGGCPVVAHPPCRAWGRLRHFAKPRDDEKQLAIFAVEQVRRFGGVLEHPEGSTLWGAAGLPAPGQRDEYGGWALPVFQQWWGHRAEKATLLYIVGCAPAEIPDLPFVLGKASHVIAQNRSMPDGSRMKKGHPSWRPEVSKAEREHTPQALAEWLVELASRCGADCQWR